MIDEASGLEDGKTDKDEKCTSATLSDQNEM